MSGRLHLLYGLSGSGKSTLARQLQKQSPAVRFTLDEWMLRLHPELSIDDPAYGDRAEVVQELIWSIAEQTLRSEVDAVLDWNSWSRARRAWARERAGTVGAEVVLHRLSTSLEESTRRAQLREESQASFAHRITLEGNQHLTGLLEEPTADEGLTILEH
ncbi:AAA family ATPase [Brachybacterium sp. 107]|uniref:AAA family ATPase n=1 Tax=Brachybacterium sp. 107 TaxID=3457736 RepID=UPI0040344C9E